MAAVARNAVLLGRARGCAYPGNRYSRFPANVIGEGCATGFDCECIRKRDKHLFACFSNCTSILELHLPDKLTFCSIQSCECTRRVFAQQLRTVSLLILYQIWYVHDMATLISMSYSFVRNPSSRKSTARSICLLLSLDLIAAIVPASNG